jgi:hypothetical protein
MEEQPLLLRKQKHREPLLCVTPAPEDGEPGDGEPNVDGAALWITGNAQACAGWVKTLKVRSEELVKLYSATTRSPAP